MNFTEYYKLHLDVPMTPQQQRLVNAIDQLQEMNKSYSGIFKAFKLKEVLDVLYETRETEKK